MKNGKHAAAGGMKRSLVLVVSVLALVLAVAGGTLAWLSANTTPVTNTFTPAHVTCEVVEEKFDGTTKENVQIKNTSNIDAYIRAYVVVTWKNAQGNVYGKLPELGKDYTIEYATGTGWDEGSDGYYYYTSPVAANDGLTGVLITKCEPVNGQAPADYDLSVEIIAEAIQSQPDSAVQQAWGVTIANGKVTAYNSGN